METFKKKIQYDTSLPLNIYFLGDIHKGHANHAAKELRLAVDMIKNDPQAIWIGMGDYIDAITIDDKKRFNPIEVDQSYTLADLKDLPFKQLEDLYKDLAPIDDKCIAITIGNHEESYVKYNHSDVYKRFFDMFKSKPKKLGYVGFIALSIDVGNASYFLKIATNHGVGGGGQLRGSAINKVHQVFRYTECDINVMGHIHRLVEDDLIMATIDRNGNFKEKQRIWASSGCFLKTYKEGSVNYFEARAQGVQTDVGLYKVAVERRKNSRNVNVITMKGETIKWR